MITGYYLSGSHPSCDHAVRRIGRRSLIARCSWRQLIFYIICHLARAFPPNILNVCMIIRYSPPRARCERLLINVAGGRGFMAGAYRIRCDYVPRNDTRFRFQPPAETAHSLARAGIQGCGSSRSVRLQEPMAETAVRDKRREPDMHSANIES